jgi:excisionase family DNA binding protein
MATTTVVTEYNLTEAAEKIGVSRVTLWRHIRDGRLVTHKRGREVFIWSADLLEYVLRYRGGTGIPQG